MSDLTPDVTRKLVAVFAADVEGYSRLMGADEVATLKGLTERRAVLDRIIGEHRGRIANTAGDSVLAEFGSAVDAVKCAVDAQAALAEENSNLPSDRRINFRIGVHIGDVMVRGGDLFGDGVNIAARLQTMAKPGGVCISGATHDQVRKVLPVSFVDLGAQQVKNIQEPIKAHELVVDGNERAHTPLGETKISPPLADKPSIAVLPFQNMSGDPEQEYFADGVVDGIITALSQFKLLFVIARNSSFAYKGKSPDIRQVGRDLGVKYVLEGSVRRAGNRLRITAQLIDAQIGAHIWADRFEGSPEDIFEFQDNVTEKVVVAIAPRLERAEIARALRRTSGSTEAYDCFLKALACFFRGTTQGHDEALDLLNEACVLDPDFASAHAAMVCRADRLSMGAIKDLAREKNEVRRLWRIVARIGNDDGRALAGAGWAVAFLLRDLQSGKEMIDRAIELNPNLVNAQESAGWISIWLGEPEVAIEKLIRAQQLDPVSVSFPSAMAHAYYFMGRYEEALDRVQDLLRRQPDVHDALRVGAAAAAFAGRVDVAQELARHLLEVDPAFCVSRLNEYLGPHRRPEFVEKYTEGLRRAGLPEVPTFTARSD
jgi:TolB-like protein/class 3 adenylate cyclase/Tfp pilus assembly protein PilF